jgi:rhamnosyltransferase
MRSAAVIVAFNPKQPLTSRINILLGAVDIVYVINNGSELFLPMNEFRPDSVVLITNSSNIGLAGALNRGLLEAFSTFETELVILFDQDSRPSGDLVQKLFESARSAKRAGLKVAVMTPTLQDEKNPTTSIGKPRPKNLKPIFEAIFQIQTAATSGSVLSREAYETVGPMLDDLFIDGIDHEWSFRAKRHGYFCYRDGSVIMPHNMGDIGLVFRRRQRPIHTSPLRHYFIVRNTFYLVKLPYVDRKWKIYEILKTVPRALAYVWFSSDSRVTVVLMALGVRDGLLGNLDRRPSQYFENIS